jgi:hypothetical protein
VDERRTNPDGGNGERVEVPPLLVAVGRVALRATIEVEDVKPVR